MILFNIFISSFRWKTLLETGLSKKISYLNYLRLTWIGLLFNSVLPGAVSGDFIKLVYAKQLDRSLSKSFLLISVLMDRILGLIALLTILGVTTLFNWQKLILMNPQLEKIVHFNFILFLGAMTFFIIIFLSKNLQNHILSITKNIPKLGLMINKVLGQIWLIGAHKYKIVLSFSISIVGQLLSIFGFYYLTKPFYSVPLSILDIYTFVPIGLVATAIPITPAGLGLGHAAFDTLFSFYHINNGASLFNLYFLANVASNCLGIFPYIFSNLKVTQKEIATFEGNND
jgi:uncharacterized membrane protein YbhN (UPF0104 family)